MNWYGLGSGVLFSFPVFCIDSFLNENVDNSCD